MSLIFTSLINAVSVCIWIRIGRAHYNDGLRITPLLKVIFPLTVFAICFSEALALRQAT